MKQRNSSLELLRIIMMIQIIFLHFSGAGGYAEISNSLTLGHQYVFRLTWLLSRCPVYIFMMLTGYFLINKKMDYKAVLNRIKKIYKPMIFYSILIAVVGVIFGFWKLKEISVPKIFTPFLSANWYFLTGYILLIIFSPFLNRLIHNLSKKEFQTLIILLLLILCIWAPISYLEPFSTFIRTSKSISNEFGKSLYDYIFMYFIGAYISLYTKNSKPNFNYLFVFLGCGIASFSLSLLIPEYKNIMGFNDNLFTVIQCVCLVMFFKNLKFNSKIVNYIASFTLVVYIIHDHYLLCYYFWDNVVKLNEKFFASYFYPLKIIGLCLLVYIVCMLIDMIRRLIFKGFNKIAIMIQNGG